MTTQRRSEDEIRADLAMKAAALEDLRGMCSAQGERDARIELQIARERLADDVPALLADLAAARTEIATGQAEWTRAADERYALMGERDGQRQRAERAEAAIAAVVNEQSIYDDIYDDVYAELSLALGTDDSADEDVDFKRDLTARILRHFRAALAEPSQRDEPERGGEGEWPGSLSATSVAAMRSQFGRDREAAGETRPKPQVLSDKDLAEIREAWKDPDYVRRLAADMGMVETVEVDNPMRREVRPRRGTETGPGPRRAADEEPGR